MRPVGRSECGYIQDGRLKSGRVRARSLKLPFRGFGAFSLVMSHLEHITLHFYVAMGLFCPSGPLGTWDVS
jgi:hypothetical protein